MKHQARLLSALAVAGCVAALASPTFSKPSDPGARFGPPLAAGDCFRQRDWQGWEPAGDNTVYFRTRPGDVYRLSFYGSNSDITALDLPGRYLVTRIRGADLVCSAQDFDMKVVDRTSGAVVQLFPRAIAKLSDAEAKALPERLRSALRVR